MKLTLYNFTYIVLVSILYILKQICVILLWGKHGNEISKIKEKWAHTKLPTELESLKEHTQFAYH